ncbi:3-oxo-tetronate 4-phosphate decarboxylase [Pelagibacterium sp.]|uniref:3-oxo-tetronate 4-phosphate decarboxylase n=1 Tax=Pelagibacterium sp. TaxID=1967288 RepID=UPI003BAD4DFC
MTAISSEETRMRDQIVALGQSIFERKLTGGSTGNISVRMADGHMLMTPTNASLGDLDPSRLSLLDPDGTYVSGDKPTKEAFLHTCMYCARPQDTAVVHLHSTHSVAVSILGDVDLENVLPPLTAYYVMRVGKLPLVPYFAPGDAQLARAVEQQANRHHAMLLANHGPVVSGPSLLNAQYAIEELEETAKLFLLLDGRPIRPLTPQQVDDLERKFTR